MSEPNIGLIDNLEHIDSFVLNEAYRAPTSRYAAAVGGNTGNLAFVHGTRRCIDNPIVRMNWGWGREQVHAKATQLVISCANQVGVHVDLHSWADAIERMDRPVTLVGLGAQTPNYEQKLEIPKGTLRFLKAVQDRRPGGQPNIAVRGEFTQAILADNGIESEALGCPSLFISPERDLGRRISEVSAQGKPRRVGVAAGNPFHPANRKVEKKMLDLCEMHDGAYVVQHPDSLLAMTLGDRGFDGDKLATVARVLGFGDVQEAFDWFSRNAWCFHDAQTWLHFIGHYDAVIGARYHGVAFAVQAGVPAMAIHIDNRTRELAATTGIPSIGVAEVEALSLREIVRACHWSDEVGAAFDLNRRGLAGRMAAFLEANQITPSAGLTALAAAD